MLLQFKDTRSRSAHVEVGQGADPLRRWSDHSRRSWEGQAKGARNRDLLRQEIAEGKKSTQGFLRIRPRELSFCIVAHYAS